MLNNKAVDGLILRSVAFLGSSLVFCFRSYRMLRVSLSLSYEQRTTRTPRTWPLHIYISEPTHLNHTSQSAFSCRAKQNLSTYRLGVADNITILPSSVVGALLQVHVTVACVCLTSYGLCLHRGIRKRAYERTPGKS